MEHTFQSPAYRRGRQMHIIQAALEYLISILFTGSFLATLTGHLGMPDSLTGILSSVISLGCVFQLLSVLIHRKRVKPLVITLSVLNQLLFLLLYIIPLLEIGSSARIALFIAVILLAYLIYNLIHPPKVVWFMSLVDDRTRGSFTATKEIVSLISGMLFSFLMGVLVDHFVDIGQMKTAFALSALVLLVLTGSHTVTMLLTVEPVSDTPGKQSSGSLISVLRDPKIWRIAAVSVFYYMATYASQPFFGTYQINELGFSLKLVSLLAMLGSVIRILVSRAWGRYADRRSFAVMVEKCFLVLALSLLCAMLAVPANGKLMFALYYICHGIALGGINSAMTNLVFDYAPPEKRSDSLAVSQAVSGLAGFLTTLAVSPLISNIQLNGNRFLGLPVYAQQVASAISLALLIAGALYTRLVIIRRYQRPGI